MLNFDWTVRLKYLLRKRPKSREPFYRALNPKKTSFQAIDGSAGRGFDALYMAVIGFKVTAFERQVEIFKALIEAKEKALEELKEGPYQEILHRVKIVHADIKDYPPEQAQEGLLFYDPMYLPLEEKGKMSSKKEKSLPNKEMQWLQGLDLENKNDLEEIEEVMSWYKKTKLQRLILKRPVNFPAYKSSILTLQGSFEGTTTRYDLYQ